MNSMERAQRRRRQRRRRQPRRERRQERLQQGGSRSARARGRAASTSWTFISVLAQFSVKRSFLYGVVAIILGMFVVAFVDSRGWIDGDGPGFWAIVINIGIVTYSMAAVGGINHPRFKRAWREWRSQRVAESKPPSEISGGGTRCVCLCGPDCAECGPIVFDSDTQQLYRGGWCTCYIVDEGEEDEELICHCPGVAAHA